MINLDVTILGLALALDAGIVSFALGLLVRHEPYHKRMMKFCFISCLFGLFQGLIMWIGSRVGEFVTFSYLGPMFLYLVATIFFVISFKLFSETFGNDNEKMKSLSWKLGPVIALAFVTSIDALATGMSLATVPRAYLSATWVGIVTTLVCFLFTWFSHFFESIPEKWLLRLGAFIFFMLGLEVVIKQFMMKG